ncbi:MULTISPECIES: hypothetical protein [unclassified Clostridium]|uniref:hypothetical protein n=1 Tax=unclassified Clostridium TaxID=2614128 RepID=UPI00290D7E21|nr:hypothetical protein [Clostridium sp.]MDU5106745.1 hypothetical protein [Clostridium sp.]
MGHRPNAKDELKEALSSINHAQELLNDAIDTVEKEENRQLLQNTLANVNKAINATRTSTYGYK